MIEVLLSKEQREGIVLHLQRAETEQVAFLFLAQDQLAGKTRFQVEDYYAVPRDELVFESEYHAEITEEAQAKVIKMAWDKGLALGEIHSHPGDYLRIAFSASDLIGLDEFVPHIWWRLKRKPYIAFVFHQDEFDSLVWIANPREPDCTAEIVVDGTHFSPTGYSFREFEEQRYQEQLRYSRQSSFFGVEGQEKLSEKKVALIGLGKLGCHISQQLAYLGVQDFSLIDYDTVSISNLNRLIGATPQDLNEKKINIAKRLIRSIQPKATIIPIDASLISQKAFDAIRLSDVVFGCVDDDGARLLLLEVCCNYRKPYLDLATEIPDSGAFGGRVIFTGLGAGCPMCRNELDQKEIQQFFASPEQRKEHERIYGIDRENLAGTGPSVVMLNGLVASLAVTEFVAFVTGIRAPRPFLTYRGEMGTVHTSQDRPNPNCFYCVGIAAQNHFTDLKRFLT